MIARGHHWRRTLCQGTRARRRVIIAAMSLAGPASEPPSVAAARLLQILEAKFGEGLAAARAPGARGPAADAESLRIAYLDLLKLCLCDLVGTRTTSVTRTFDGDVMSRELDGEQLRFRTAGMDWPLHGLTMVGLARLDDLQSCIETVVADQIEGDLIEAGTWRGGAAILMRATLDSLGEVGRTVFVADSFQGFPQVDHNSGGYDLAVDLAGCDYLAIPLEEVQQNFARFGLSDGVTFVPGFFEDTLLGLAGRQWSIVRLDGDTYDATRFSLEALYPTLSPGGFLIVDDYLQIDPCREAVDDFRRERGITEPIEPVDWSGARWRRESEPEAQDGAAPPPPAPAHASNGSGALRAVQRRPRARVPAIEEVELRHELELVSGRLAAAEAEVARLRGSSLRRLLAGGRRRLGRALRGRA
jgi:macrocin-O-methyltransferase TylF-like protien